MLLMDVIYRERNIHYKFYGEVSTNKDKEYEMLEFEDLKMTSIEDSVEKDYNPNYVSFIGHRWDEEDCIVSIIDALTRGDDSWEILSINEEIERVVQQYLKDSFEYKDRKIPVRVSKGQLVLELLLATDRFLYYCLEDIILMVDASDGKIVSDNYFAETGYWDSLANVRKGKEILIWGFKKQTINIKKVWQDSTSGYVTITYEDDDCTYRYEGWDLVPESIRKCCEMG